MTTIQVRRDTAADWTSADPVLASGEHGFETDTGKFKIGDGATAWSSLGYSLGEGSGGATNLTVSRTASTVTVLSDTGTDAALPAADSTDAGVMTAAMQTKLSGIATGATANSSDATLLNRNNHTGTQSADTLTDGTTNKAFLAAERTKLAGVATGATVNSSDATLLNRSNHTGTQTAATISDAVRTVIVATGSETRPTTTGTVLWIGGSSQPTNYDDTKDIWFGAA